jgi:iron complex transport system substrate-binding protein
MVSIVLAATDVGATPNRIVSLNLCTDTMLFELAERERIVSISALSRDPTLSMFAELAERIPVNHGLAEEVVSLDPDLVLVGTYTAVPTTLMLERLGFRVARFRPANSFAEFEDNFLRLAELIGRRDLAEARLATFKRRLASVAKPTSEPPVRAIIYQPSGYTPGARSLAGNILTAAGLTDVNTELGLEAGGFVPLENLVAVKPALVVTSEHNPRYPALAELVLSHPALVGKRAREGPAAATHVVMSEKYWTCGSTFMADAVVELANHLNAARATALGEPRP